MDYITPRYLFGRILNKERQPEVESKPLIDVTTEKMTDTPIEPVIPSQAYRTYEDKGAKFSINYPIAKTMYESWIIK